MKNADDKLARLLRSAAQSDEEIPATAPFGFETRVVALWRAHPGKPNGVTGLLRRVALVSAAVLVISTVAAVREIKKSDELGDAASNEFAIADTLIQNEFIR